VDEGGGGLKVDIYKANNAEPMMAAGYIYEDKKNIAGQIYFKEKWARRLWSD